jgi:hypothetical protein
MAESESRIASLRDAGFEIKAPLPDAYEDVIEGLSNEELKTLIDVKQRLDAAELRTSPDAGSYRSYFHPF